MPLTTDSIITSSPSCRYSFEPSLFSDDLLREIRSRFMHVESEPGIGKRIFFENGGGSLTLRSVIDIQNETAALPANAGRDNAGSHMVEKYIADGTRAVKDFLHVDSGIVVSCESTTSHAYRIIEAATAHAKPGSNVVCSDLDHACFYDATAYYADKKSLARRVVPMDTETGVVTADAFLKHVDQDTSLVSVIHASNITGGKNDLRAIAEGIRKKAPDAYIIADGAQHVQHATADVAELGVDSYVFSAYKAFSCPSYAFAYISERAASLPHTRLAGKNPTDWNLGTRDQSAYACFAKVVEYLCWLGEQIGAANCESSDRRAIIKAAYDAIESHELALGQRLLHGAGGAPGLLHHTAVQVFGNKNLSRDREAVFAFRVDGMSAKDVVKYFVQRGVIVHDRTNDAYSGHTLGRLGVDAIVRVSLAHYNTCEEVEQFLVILNMLVEG